jgi:HEAT repeat protein
MPGDIRQQILSILSDAEACAREDVMWKCSVALLALLETPSGIQSLYKIDYASNYATHVVALKALGRMYGSNDIRLQLITESLPNADIAVRDAAVSALVDLADRRAIPQLQDRLAVETDARIREAIADALVELADI